MWWKYFVSDKISWIIIENENTVQNILYKRFYVHEMAE